MKSFFISLFASGALFALSACAGSTPVSIAPTAVPPTSTAIAQPSLAAPTLSSTVEPTAQVSSLTAHDCELVTRHDIAGFFSGETSQPVQQVKTVDHPVFSTDTVPVIESSCLLYTYNVSALKSGHSYQTTYWVDRPARNEPDQWAKLWSDAESQGAQPVSGIGDEAFIKGSILTFKKGDLYVSVQVLRMDANEEASASDQLDLDKKVALQATSRIH